MDSRRCSAALGFTLLIGCVIGIVIIIHNSGSSRRSSTSSSTTMQHNHHHHRVSGTTKVGGRSGEGGSDHFISSPKDEGFKNYDPSQLTLQDVNDLAVVKRILSKTKHVTGSSSNSSGKGAPVNAAVITAMKKTNNGSMASSATSSSKQASITAVNYSSVPKKKPVGSMTVASSEESMPNTQSASATATNFSSLHRNHPLPSSSVNRQEVPENHKPYQQQQQQKNQKLSNHHQDQNPYPGQQGPSMSPSLQQSPFTIQNTAENVRRGALATQANTQQEGGGGVGGADFGGGLAQNQNDLYTNSWHPSIVSPAGGGMALVPPNHPYQRRAHINNNNPQLPRQSFPAKINKTGKGTGYPYPVVQPNHIKVPNQRPYQHGYHHYQHDHEEVDPDQDGDIFEVDEDDVSANLDNLKREGERADDDNDIVHDNDEDAYEEEDEEDEDEENEEDNGANPGFLMEPKHFAADLETLFSLANHLYTSPASLLSTFSALAKSNSTKTSDTGSSTTSIPTSSAFPAAFQGFLKVINETIQRGNNSKLLVELNEMYRGREARMSSSGSRSSTTKSYTNGNNANQTGTLSSFSGMQSSSTSGLMKTEEPEKEQTPHEKSLTSFIFMSFGVFLLNQIHSFVQKTAGDHLNHHHEAINANGTGAAHAEGRAFPWEDYGPFTWYSPKSEMIMTVEPSTLDILFQPPVPQNLSFSSEEHISDHVSGRSSDSDDNAILISTGEGGHVNNMFRALLNMANAYTKDSPALECIWSLYCKDLDQTAQKKGLYGVAARINSVGLRLIMKQIPPALTFDVILRSLVGWDGLPCHKMFPECAVGNGTMSTVSGDEVLL